MKRGRASGRYGQHRRAVTGTFNDVLDQHEAEAQAAKQRLLDALTTLKIFIDCARDVRDSAHRDITPSALNALAVLRELVDNTDFYFE